MKLVKLSLLVFLLSFSFVLADTFVVDSDLGEVIDEIEIQGGTLLQVFPDESLIVADLPEDVYLQGVVEVEDKFNDLDKYYSFEPGPIMNDVFLSPSSSINKNVYSSPSNSLGTSDYLYGKVLVNVVFVESNGSIDSNIENWTDSKISNVSQEIVSGISWWLNRSSVDLSFYFTFNVSNVSYEPILHPQSSEGLWISEVMDGFGVADCPGLDNCYFYRALLFNDDLRNSYETDWSFTIFVVDSEFDSDGMFFDSYFAYAYLNGPFFVMTYDNQNYGIENMEAVAAHEMGHIFGALDQYSEVGLYECSCSDSSGFLNISNQNCVDSCLIDEASIMRGGITPYYSSSLDLYGAGQIGWWDEDNNSIVDCIESSFNNGLNNDNDSIIDYWDLDDDNDLILDVLDACPFEFGVVELNGCANSNSSINLSYGSFNYTFNDLYIYFNVSDAENVSSVYLHYLNNSLFTNESYFIVPSLGNVYRDVNVSFIFEVIDGLNESFNYSFNVFIANSFPYVSLSNFTIEEENNLSFSFNGSDLDGDLLFYYVSSGLVNGSNYSYFSFLDYFGVDEIFVNVSDGLVNVSSSFFINVTNVNDAPVAVVEDKTYYVGDNICLESSSYDVDGDGLVYYWNSSLELNNSCFVGSKGSFIFGLIVGDGLLNSSLVNFSLKVVDRPVASGGGGGSGGSSSSSKKEVVEEVVEEVKVLEPVVQEIPFVEEIVNETSFDVVEESWFDTFFSSVKSFFVSDNSITGASVSELNVKNVVGSSMLFVGFILVVFGFVLYFRRK